MRHYVHEDGRRIEVLVHRPVWQEFRHSDGRRIRLPLDEAVRERAVRKLREASPDGHERLRRRKEKKPHRADSETDSSGSEIYEAGNFLDPRIMERDPLEEPLTPSEESDGRLDYMFGEAMDSFSGEAHGKNIRVSPDLMKATYTAGCNELYGSIIGNGTIPLVQGGAYFEVRLDAMHPVMQEDGLTVGVTATNPGHLEVDMPQILQGVDSTWLVGFNGKMWDGAIGEMATIDWKPARLKVGSVVGVFIARPSGDMTIYVNGWPRVQGPRGIPDINLFPALDLLGAVRVVTLLKSD